MIQTIQAKIEEMKAPDDVAQTRMQVCQTCPKFKQTMKICGACGCYLPAKTKLKGSTCPLNKW